MNVFPWPPKQAGWLGMLYNTHPHQWSRSKLSELTRLFVDSVWMIELHCARGDAASVGGSLCVLSPLAWVTHMFLKTSLPSSYFKRGLIWKSSPVHSWWWTVGDQLGPGAWGLGCLSMDTSFTLLFLKVSCITFVRVNLVLESKACKYTLCIAKCRNHKNNSIMLPSECTHIMSTHIKKQNISSNTRSTIHASFQSSVPQG